MWQFVGVLCVLLLPSVRSSFVYKPPIRDCPSNKVCVNFVKDSCRDKVNEEFGYHEARARLWTFNYNELCYYHDVAGIYALLDIEVLDPYTWSFYVALYEFRRAVNENKKFKFVFGGSELTFSGPSLEEAKAEFTWGSKSAPVKLTYLKEMPEVYVDQFTFLINADGERLRHIIGYTVTFVHPYYEGIKLNDGRFGSQLAAKSKCWVSDLKQVCIGGPCDTMPEWKYDNMNHVRDRMHWKSTESIAQFCPSKLWYHDKTVDKANKLWKDADDRLQCFEVGEPFGSWSISGMSIDKNKHEFQCSAAKPEDPTPTSTAPAETTATETTIESETVETAAPETAEPTPAATTEPAATVPPGIAAPEAPAAGAKAATFGAVTGGVMGGLLLLVVVALGVFICWKRQKRNRELRNLTHGSSSLSKTSSKAQTPGTEIERVKMEMRQQSPGTPSPVGAPIQPGIAAKP